MVNKGDVISIFVVVYELENLQYIYIDLKNSIQRTCVILTQEKRRNIMLGLPK